MRSIFTVFKRGLQKTATSMTRSVETIFSEAKAWDEGTYDELEAVLLGADFGVETTRFLIDDLRDRYSTGRIKTAEDAREVLALDIRGILCRNEREICIQEGSPTVIFLVGVNGSGKTTTAGKLAAKWKADGKKVMLAAGDTFRAAAVEQINLWGEKVGCPVISSKAGADPSSVVYDAVQSVQSRGYDILIVDTAGRQHNKTGLMEELSKMRRVACKVLPGAPHETWLTIDSGIGTNALRQATEFARFAEISGLVLTKLDGTGRGGMAVAIQNLQALPVFFCGFGEKTEDLQPFDADMFARAVFQLDGGTG